MLPHKYYPSKKIIQRDEGQSNLNLGRSGTRNTNLLSILPEVVLTSPLVHMHKTPAFTDMRYLPKHDYDHRWQLEGQDFLYRSASMNAQFKSRLPDLRGTVIIILELGGEKPYFVCQCLIKDDFWDPLFSSYYHHHLRV